MRHGGIGSMRLSHLAALWGCIVVLLSSPAWAVSTGITGVSGKQGPICTSCHSGGLPPDVRFEGPTMVQVGELATFRFVVTSRRASQIAAGLNVASSAGQLGVVAGEGTRLIANEITHTGPKDNVDDEAGWQ